jgi:hypothetical protein
MLNYDPMGYWKEFLNVYHIRHEKIYNDEKKFILYYESEFHLLKLGFEFGLFCSEKELYAKK